MEFLTVILYFTTQLYSHKYQKLFSYYDISRKWDYYTFDKVTKFFLSKEHRRENLIPRYISGWLPLLEFLWRM